MASLTQPYNGIHFSIRVTPAMLAHASNLRTYFRQLRRAKFRNDEQLIADSIRRISSWKPVITIRELISQAADMKRNGQNSFYLFFNGTRYFVTSDRNYGGDYLSGNWAVTRYHLFYSSYDNAGNATVCSGIEKMICDLASNPYIKSIDTPEALCKYVNELEFGAVMAQSRYIRQGMEMLQDKDLQAELCAMADQLDYC